MGDGTVILAQRADDNGLSQAFSSVSIVSGRPTLVLNDDKQINPDNIKWGYHGGKLDINGNSLTFHKLNGADDGAILTNSGSMANVNLISTAQIQQPRLLISGTAISPVI